MSCKIVKSNNGKKWWVIIESGERVFVGSTRRSCFEYAQKNGIMIRSYQHGN